HHLGPVGWLRQQKKRASRIGCDLTRTLRIARSPYTTVSFSALEITLLVWVPVSVPAPPSRRALTLTVSPEVGLTLRVRLSSLSPPATAAAMAPVLPELAVMLALIVSLPAPPRAAKYSVPLTCPV